MQPYKANPTALFIPCTLDGYDPHTGSALIRAQWVAKYWPGALVYDGRQSLTGWNLVIFQKAYLAENTHRFISGLAKVREERGAPVLAFDLCDPDFLDAPQRQRLLDILPTFDFAVAPTQPLVSWLAQYLPAHLIPDTFDPEAITVNHDFAWAGQPKLVWIGYHANRAALSPLLLHTVQKYGLRLDIFDLDKPLPFTEFLQVLTQYDVLLNPQPDSGRFRYKSNNKSLIAWAAGVAVAESDEDLHALANPEWHSGWIAQRLAELQLEKYHSHYAVAAWRAAYHAYQEVYGENSGY